MTLQNCRRAERVGLGIVHVPEGRQMLQGLTVHENLLLGAYVRKREPMSAIHETEREIYQLFPNSGRTEKSAGRVIVGGATANVSAWPSTHVEARKS